MAAVGAPIRPRDRRLHECAIAAARSRLDECAFTAAWAEGRAMPPEQAIAAAFAAPDVVENADGLTAAARVGPAALSPRELDVLRLIDAGHSNRDIGEALGISYRTATTHITNIFNKLGASSRTAALAVARRQGLI
jgi:DNA-binding NarL/FixJ family response regulator